MKAKLIEHLRLAMQLVENIFQILLNSIANHQ